MALTAVFSCRSFHVFSLKVLLLNIVRYRVRLKEGGDAYAAHQTHPQTFRNPRIMCSKGAQTDGFWERRRGLEWPARVVNKLLNMERIIPLN